MHTTQYAGSGSRTEHAYQSLKRRLLFGEFGLGLRLAEERLAAEMEISRTPVREALSRLSAEGLVSRHPNGGFSPTPPDLEHTRELYEVRFALEFDALARPLRTGVAHDEAKLAALRDDWSQLAPPEMSEQANPDFALLDEEFHVRLAAASGNVALAEVLARTNERIRPVRMHDFVTRERIERTIEQHVEVLDAVIEGDLGTGRTLLERHFSESYEVVEQRAAAALSRMWSLAREDTR